MSVVRPFVATILALGSVLALDVPCAAAHEIGTTRAAMRIEGGRYVVEVATDAAALLEKLETVSNLPLTESSAGPATLEARLQPLATRVPQRVHLWFGAEEMHPEIAVRVVPAAGAGTVPAAMLTFSGDVPTGAREWSWSYGWTFASYALTVRGAGAGGGGSDEGNTVWLDGDERSTAMPLQPVAPPSGWRIAQRYLVLGFTHIVPLGFDHVLFVAGIFLLSRKPRHVMAQVTAFTVAHSITLALGMYGVLSLPSRIVEPLIALSIGFVAVENLLVKEMRPRRVAIVFGFGLLHGLGFAGALQELALRPSEFVTALAAFNVGVECGQLAVIGAAWLLLGLPFGGRTWYRARVAMPASAAIALMAAYWTIERLR